MGQGERCERGRERGAEGKPIRELPRGAQLCPAPHGSARPLPGHRQLPPRIYLLHIALSDGPAGSQDLSHLGHDRVVVHAGHGHHLIAPRDGQSRAVREAPAGHRSITQKATRWREVGSKEKPTPGPGPISRHEQHGGCAGSVGQGPGGGSELDLQAGPTGLSAMLRCRCG